MRTLFAAASGAISAVTEWVQFLMSEFSVSENAASHELRGRERGIKCSTRRSSSGEAVLDGPIRKSRWSSCSFASRR
jgi:hypothetical protein